MLFLSKEKPNLVSIRLAINIFSAAGQTIVQTVILLLLYRHLIARIGIEELGIWSVVLATLSVARISEFGFGGSVLKFVAIHHAQRDDKTAAECLQTAAITVGGLFGVIALIGYPMLLSALPHVLPVAGLDVGRAIFPYGLVSLWLSSVGNIWMNALDAYHRSGLRACVMIFSSLVFFLLAMVGVNYYGLMGLAAAQVVQGLVIVTVGWVVIRRVNCTLPVFPWRWKIARFREIFSYGLNFQINSVVALLFEPITKIFLGRYGGLSVAGYFEMAQQIVIKVRALVVESNRVIIPVYAGMETYDIDAPKLYLRNTRTLLYLVIPVFASLTALVPAICEAWIGSFQPQFVSIGCWITLAWFLNTASAPAYFAYLGQGKLRWVTTAHIVMGATNICSGFLLGRFFGWQGIIAAFVGSLVLGSLLPVFAYNCEHRIKFLQFLSPPDVISAGVCFGFALFVLASYWALLDSNLIVKWQRIIIFTCAMGMVSATTLWLHPLRRIILDMATACFIVSDKKVKNYNIWLT